MNGVPLAAYIGLGLFMFTTGVVGVVVRKSPIVIFMCIELMLNSVNLTFLAFARYQMHRTLTGTDSVQHSMMAGQMMVIFVMAVAAAEVAVGLGIIMAIFRLRDNVDIDEMNLLRG
jgi:NADH-quinone oxidoreductase subunit K